MLCEIGGSQIHKVRLPYFEAHGYVGSTPGPATATSSIHFHPEEFTISQRPDKVVKKAQMHTHGE